MNDFPEQDWKVFKRVQVSAQFRYCESVLQQATGVLADKAKDPYERFAALAALMKEREKEFRQSLTAYSRSSALLELCIMDRLGLLAEEELGQLSNETRDRILRSRESRQQ